jgi:uridine phosphorylase
LAEYILLVGDPSRAKRVAQRFKKVHFEQQYREFVTITGDYKGMDLTVLATGIGCDNTEIAMIEACQITKHPTFIRCGSTGALHKKPNLADLIISQGAVRLDNTTSFFVVDGYPALADPNVTLALAMACRDQKLPFHIGITACAPGFYGAQGREMPGFPIRYPNLPDDLARMNVLNFEMETSSLFVLASLRGIRAGAVCAVFASRPRDVFADEATRTKAETRCIDASLTAFELLKSMDSQRYKEKLPLWLPPKKLFAHR